MLRMSGVSIASSTDKHLCLLQNLSDWRKESGCQQADVGHSCLSKGSPKIVKDFIWVIPLLTWSGLGVQRYCLNLCACLSAQGSTVANVPARPLYGC